MLPYGPFSFSPENHMQNPPHQPFGFFTIHHAQPHSCQKHVSMIQQNHVNFSSTSHGTWINCFCVSIWQGTVDVCFLSVIVTRFYGVQTKYAFGVMSVSSFP